ncbi:site-specific integrase [Myceligenerans xiligouense]|uniref:Site-specific recombinase XerD n=1 Tax=Myceligenerans xiligouense TaxID=253184 RepID=A0A3N4YMT6_9MICO|nr:site-specific integrase [Myceligenerans xiligouense]RPF21427.1 site-specific recombinase XerD [Myceligenerans xiligouense]
MAKETTRRMFGALEARKNRKTGEVTSWRARYTGPDTERHERPFVDKMAGEAWLNAERILIDRGEWTPPKVRDAAERARSQQAITLRDWAERSMVNKALRTSTRDRYRRMLNKRILPALGDIPLADLTRMDVTTWYMTLAVTLAKEADERRARGYKGNTDGRGALYSAYQVLSSILADAVDHELLDVSPAKVKGGLQYDPLHEPVVLTSEQMWQLTDLLPDYLRAFVPLLATTGLRKGEMRALMCRHLTLDDPERAVVQVRGTVAVPGRNYKIGDPKTKRSRRDIAIPSFVVPILREHIDRFSEPGPGGIVFPAKSGGVLSVAVIESWWQGAREQVGLADLHVHDLRHTALTWAARSGATLAELMAIAGHSTPEVALRYQHVGDEERRHAIAEKVGAVFQDELAHRRATRARTSDDVGKAGTAG